MADLKLTATALYIGRYCQIGKRKTKNKMQVFIVFKNTL